MSSDCLLPRIAIHGARGRPSFAGAMDLAHYRRLNDAGFLRVAFAEPAWGCRPGRRFRVPGGRNPAHGCRSGFDEFRAISKASEIHPLGESFRYVSSIPVGGLKPVERSRRRTWLGNGLRMGWKPRGKCPRPRLRSLIFPKTLIVRSILCGDPISLTKDGPEASGGQ